MLRKHNLILFSLLVLLGGACEDSLYDGEGSTHIEGIIVDAVSKQPIPNAEVHIIGAGGGVLGGGGSAVYAEGFSDSSGHFSFYVEDVKQDDSYYAMAFKENYDETDNRQRIKDPYKSHTTVNLKPKGFIRVHLKNVSPCDDLDYISVNGLNLTRPRPSGIDVDTTICCMSTSGSTKKKVSYFVGKCGQPTKNYQKEIWVPALDTVTLLIEY